MTNNIQRGSEQENPSHKDANFDNDMKRGQWVCQLDFGDLNINNLM